MRCRAGERMCPPSAWLRYVAVGSLKPDTQNFNRLLVSLGLIAIGLAVVAPWLVYRDTGVLTISSAKLATVTHSARASLMDRQHILRSVQEALPFVAGALFALGVGLLVWGGLRMKEAQTWEDRTLRAQTRQHEASVEPQTSEDKELRQHQAQAEEILAEVPAAVAGELSDTEPSDGARLGPQRFNALTGDSIRDWAKVAREVEREVFDRIALITPPPLRFDAEVKVRSPDWGQILLDGLIRSSGVAPDLVVEVKVRSGPLGAATRMDADALIANLVRYRAATGRAGFGWLILVFTGDEAEWERFRLDNDGRLRRLLATYATYSVVRQDQIDTLELPLQPEVTPVGVI